MKHDAIDHIIANERAIEKLVVDIKAIDERLKRIECNVIPEQPNRVKQDIETLSAKFYAVDKMYKAARIQEEDLALRLKLANGQIDKLLEQIRGYERTITEMRDSIERHRQALDYAYGQYPDLKPGAIDIVLANRPD